MLYQVHLAMNGFILTTISVMCTDCKGSCKSNYDTITTTMVNFKIYIDKIIKSTSNKMCLYEQDVHKVKVKPRNQIDYSGYPNALKLLIKVYNVRYRKYQG